MSRRQGDTSPSRKVVPRCFLRTIPNLNLQMRPSLLRCPPPKRHKPCYTTRPEPLLALPLKRQPAGLEAPGDRHETDIASAPALALSLISPAPPPSAHSSGVRRPSAVEQATQPDHNPARVAPEATASGLGDVRHRMTITKLTAPPLALSLHEGAPWPRQSRPAFADRAFLRLLCLNFRAAS